MNSKKLRLAAVLFAVLFLIPFFTRVVRTQAQSVWDGQSHINIAIDNGDIHLWSIEPSEKRIIEVIIPENVYLSVSSYGAYRANAIGKLSLLEKKDGSLFTKAIEESLGVPVDALLIRKENQRGSLDLREMFGFVGIGRIVFGGGQFLEFTNLTLYDKLALWFLSFRLNKESIETINLASSEAASKITLPDNTEGITLDVVRFSREASQYFVDRSLKDEDLTIEVLNATNKEGEANRFALLLTNIGGNVINTEKSQKQEEKTTVFAREQSYTASKIAKITRGTRVRETPKEGRADILLLLGGE